MSLVKESGEMEPQRCGSIEDEHTKSFTDLTGLAKQNFLIAKLTNQ